jgi:hypothetical protein
MGDWQSAEVYKNFFFFVTNENKLERLSLASFLKAMPIFESNARAYPSGAPYVVWGRPLLTNFGLTKKLAGAHILAELNRVEHFMVRS